MTRTQRWIAVALAGVMMLTGFVAGRVTETTRTAAEENQTTPTALNSALPTTAASSERSFYLKDFKTGYDDGYNAARTGQTTNIVETERQGYNEGFKQGYANAYQANSSPAQTTANFSNAPEATQVVYRNPPRAYYRSAPVATKRRGNSKLKTALTIAAPAAVGAGVGALVGGKKGAGVGALLGGGGGAVYHLFKNRDR